MSLKQICAAVALICYGNAYSHTNSVGYVGDGLGGVNFWYGSWHSNVTFNEAQIKITDVAASTSTLNSFNLLTTTSPAGLISGVNYFSSDGTQLIPYDPTVPHPMGMPNTSYTWQGFNFAPSSAGAYTFKYIPLGDPESTLPGVATAEWMPMDNVIQTLTVNLTTGDLSGDANNNGIPDIQEAPAGAAASGGVTPPVTGVVGGVTPPVTVVSQGSSSVIANTAVSDKRVQTLYRTQTDTTWDNMSDNSIQNTQTTNTVLPTWTGRVDQVSQINRGIGRLEFEEGIQTKGWGNSGISGLTSNIGFGKDLQGGVRFLFGVKNITGKLGDSNFSGNHFAIGASRNLGEATLKTTLNTSDFRYDVKRTIGEASNAYQTTSTSSWVDFEVSQNEGKFRPMVGVVSGSNRTEGYVETGDIRTARTVGLEKNEFTVLKVGGAMTLGPVEVAVVGYSDETSKGSVTYTKNFDKSTKLFIKAEKENQVDSLTAGFKMEF